jgi:hypothetical protein
VVLDGLVRGRVQERSGGAAIVTDVDADGAVGDFGRAVFRDEQVVDVLTLVRRRVGAVFSASMIASMIGVKVSSRDGAWRGGHVRR